MPTKCDLHTHTTCSDGILHPTQLVDKAVERGIGCLAITDHDSTESYGMVHGYAAERGIEIIPALEMSCFESGRDYHVLGYFVDADNTKLKQHLEIFRKERAKRAERIVQKLKKVDMVVNFDDVLAKAGTAPVGRPHIAAVMIDAGFTESLKGAFDRYLNPGKPGYEPKWNYPVNFGIQIINSSGGLAVLAHPGRSMPAGMIVSFIKAGLDGLEVVHPSHGPELRRHYQGIVNNYCLVGTGGSDYHGSRPYDDDNFGRYVVEYSVVEAMQVYRQGKKAVL